MVQVESGTMHIRTILALMDTICVLIVGEVANPGIEKLIVTVTNIMNLEELKKRIKGLESQIKEKLITWISADTINNRQMHVGLTPMLIKKCRKGKVWNGKEFLITLKNFKYGFDETRKRSSGGYDGIFMMDRNFRPYNSMQKKLFDQFIDKPGTEYKNIITHLGADATNIIPVRLVSHHMRLLGILCRSDQDYLVLVDYDNEKIR